MQDQQRAMLDNVGNGYLRHTYQRTDNHSPAGNVKSPEAAACVLAQASGLD